MTTLKLIIKNFWFIPLLIVAVVLVNLFVFRITLTVGNSMEPTLENGDIVLTHITKKVERYDIVVFKHENRYLIKRVIGCPGETVQIANNTILVNGIPIKDPVNIQMDDYGVASEAITLGTDEYFVMGDNRNDSYDSRSFGPINKSTLLGKQFGQEG